MYYIFGVTLATAILNFISILGLTMIKTFLVSIVLCVLSSAHPEGAPAVKMVCEELKPDSSSPHKFQSGNGAYNFTTSAGLHLHSSKYFTYEAGMEYTGKLLTIKHLPKKSVN